MPEEYSWDRRKERRSRTPYDLWAQSTRSAAARGQADSSPGRSPRIRVRPGRDSGDVSSAYTACASCRVCTGVAIQQDRMSSLKKGSNKWESPQGGSADGSPGGTSPPRLAGRPRGPETGSRRSGAQRALRPGKQTAPEGACGAHRSTTWSAGRQPQWVRTARRSRSLQVVLSTDAAIWRRLALPLYRLAGKDTSTA